MSKQITAKFLNNYGFIRNGVDDFEIHIKGFLFLSIDISSEKPLSFLFRTDPSTGHVTKPLIGTELKNKKDVKNLYRLLTGKKLKKVNNE